jgi:hypothetical protein
LLNVLKETAMTRVMIGLVAALLAWGTGAASAQTMSYSDAGALIAKSCGKDIDRYCAKVNMGGGALKDCLAKVGSKLSPQCSTDYGTALASLDKRANAQAAVPQLCKLDALRHCRGISPGDGHYLSCLNTASKVVSADCSQALADAGWN